MSELQFLYALQQLINGLQVSAFYALLAVSYVILHGVTNRFNMAFGAIATWAGYIAIGVAGTVLEETFEGPFVALALAFAFAAASAGGLGLVIGRALLPGLMRGPPLATLVATVGFAIALGEALRLATGNADLWLAPLFSEPVASLGSAVFPVRVSGMQAGVFLLSLALAGLLILLMTRSRFGRDWRACSDDAVMASLVGVDVRRVVLTSSVLAALYAAFTGALIAVHYGNIGFHNGFLIGLKALFVAVVGGLSSFAGAVGGGFLVGFLETLWSAYLPIEWRDVASFLVLTGVLVWRLSERADRARFTPG